MAEEKKESVINSFLSSKYTDPTFLTFDFSVEKQSLLFCTDDVLEPGSISFNDKTSLLAAFNDSVGKVVTTPYILLNNLGEENRARYIKTFSQSFINVVEKEQWRIQSIEGLDSIFTSIVNYKDGYSGSADEKITITCIEDVELTMNTIFEFYRKAIWDLSYKRQVVPNNLLKFDCKIIIKDRRNLIKNRNINTTSNTPVEKSILEKQKKSIQSMYNDFLLGSGYVKEKYDIPTITLTFCNCIFDLSSIGKSFDAINPGETDNNYSKYTFSFKYGKVFINYSTLDDSDKWNEFEDYEKDAESNNYSGFTRDWYERDTKDNRLTLDAANIKATVDSSLNSIKESLGEHLDNTVNDFERSIKNITSKVLGKEQGYEVGQNIYGESNFITAFGKSVGDKLTQFMDEGVGKLKGDTIGQLNSLINVNKSKLEGAIMNAESSVVNGSKKTSSSSGNKLGNIEFEESSRASSEKLSGNEKVYERNSSKSSSSFESFNIYNAPSGPKQ